MIVALAGGVGGAKFAYGLYQILPPDDLTIIVNTADDFELWGLHISPDLDTVMYTLAGLANPETGWGVAGDTWQMLDMLTSYGYDTWFRLGDRDVATHIARTEQLHTGRSLTEVTQRLSRALDIHAALLPMCDQRVMTLVDTPAGQLQFQDYFVRRRHSDPVTGVVFDGIAEASLPTAVTQALEAADVIMFCPSNPVVSIRPILAVPGMLAQLQAVRTPKVAVSPIVGGRALRGPADQMLAGLGYDVSAFGVASIYRGLIDGLVIDNIDAAQQDRIEQLGMHVLVTDTIMHDASDRQRLASETLRFAEQIRQGSSLHR